MPLLVIPHRSFEKRTYWLNPCAKPSKVHNE